MPAYSPPPGGEVRPHRNLRSLYLTYLLIAIWAGVLPWLIPLSLFFPPVYVLAFTVPILLLVIVLVWWTGAYYHSVIYRFSDGGIGWERGVWRRQAGTVPYSRITAVEIIQGPLSRLFGISMLKIRAEGDPAGGGVPDGLKIQGLTDAGSLKGFILDQMIPEKRGGGNGAGPEP